MGYPEGRGFHIVPYIVSTPLTNHVKIPTYLVPSHIFYYTLLYYTILYYTSPET
ncbi:hypothetical protein BO85DRAFT_444954 [Aspergillus piperis CBS 112811]|uniref:Uncharacterized protein n=1 Tax=Aspergillus piperis CBS 112811 TaxID=1448313 RepID=A0A8G1VR66_9EURO|nr:hypothetical protein BO85DRAFT_444954 [Aspergillus piperis CBS 112811]RAH61522.1 hypothetical protein BO85DRAFT_444954 [Aspergillus piperis CBS 112811]